VRRPRFPQTPELLVRMAAEGAAKVLQGRRKRFRALSPTTRLSISFAFVIFFGTVFLMLPLSTRDGGGLPPVDALFVSTSAVCVTGLSTIDVGASLTFAGQAAVLLLIQVGALGFMTLASGLMLGLGGKVSLLSRQAVAGAMSAGGRRSLEQLLRTGIMATLLCELAGAFILAMRFKGLPGYGWGDALWAGLFHSISAFCNAGFSTFSSAPGREGFDSFTNFVADGAVNVTLMLLIIIGGLGFLVIDDVLDWWQGRYKRPLTLHSKVVLFSSAVLIAAGAVLFFGIELSHKDYSDKGLAALGWGSVFHSVSARTAGFNSLDLARAASPTLMVLMMLMMVGGSPASCAGGVKTTTAFVLASVVWNRVLGRRNANAFGRCIGAEDVTRAATMVQFSFFFIVSALLLMEVPSDGRSAGGHFLDLLFEVVSAFSTTGLSVGVTSSLHPVSKLVLVAAMFVGRVGPLSIFVSLAEAPRNDAIRYPEERLMIG
jgi:trk system potassium uptake protein